MLIGNPLDTYKQSETFKKSSNGFDSNAYKAWKECFETWVIPLAVDVCSLEEDIKRLENELANVKE